LPATAENCQITGKNFRIYKPPETGRLPFIDEKELAKMLTTMHSQRKISILSRKIRKQIEIVAYLDKMNVTVCK
jgi:hypothetical protein